MELFDFRSAPEGRRVDPQTEPAVVAQLMGQGLIHEGAMTVNGRTMGDNCRDATIEDERVKLKLYNLMEAIVASKAPVEAEPPVAPAAPAAEDVPSLVQ